MATYGKPQSTVLDRTVQTGHVAIGEADQQAPEQGVERGEMDEINAHAEHS